MAKTHRNKRNPADYIGLSYDKKPSRNRRRESRLENYSLRDKIQTRFRFSAELPEGISQNRIILHKENFKSEILAKWNMTEDEFNDISAKFNDKAARNSWWLWLTGSASYFSTPVFDLYEYIEEKLAEKGYNNEYQSLYEGFKNFKENQANAEELANIRGKIKDFSDKWDINFGDIDTDNRWSIIFDTALYGRMKSGFSEYKYDKYKWLKEENPEERYFGFVCSEIKKAKTKGETEYSAALDNYDITREEFENATRVHWSTFPIDIMEFINFMNVSSISCGADKEQYIELLGFKDQEDFKNFLSLLYNDNPYEVTNAWASMNMVELKAKKPAPR